MIGFPKCLLALPVAFFVLLFVNNSLGCSCLPLPTVLDEIVRSENVIVARLHGFEEIDRFIDGGNVYRTYAGVMEVEKVYKGNLREKQSIRVFSGGGGDCRAGFQRNDVGTSFLFYMGGPSRTGKNPTPLYTFGVCSRSTRLENATADLKYLDNRQAREGQTRLSGKLVVYGENISLPSVANLNISIAGANFQKELKTDSDGFFELWNLRPGNYQVSVQVPNGWKIAGVRVLPAIGSDRIAIVNNSVKLSVAAKKHTELSTFFEIDNEISGKVVSAFGNPMKGVCVSAYWLTPTSDSYLIPRNCTNERGEFKISQLPPGKYRIEVNGSGRITASNPFETFYYPGVEKKEDAEGVCSRYLD
jgi:hypothetical protein